MSTQFELQRAFATAVQHHRAGRFGQAEMLYRSILAAAPNHADSLHLLGVVASQRGDHQAAIGWIEKAIALSKRKPVADYHNNIALAYSALDRPDSAIEHFKQALALSPKDAEGHYNLGVLLQRKDRWDEAAASYKRAISLMPAHVEAHGNLAAVLREQGKWDEAAVHAERAVALRPNDAAAHYNLGGLYREQGELDRAASCYRRAVALKPNFVEAHNNLGNVLKEQDRLDEAAACYERTLALRPNFAEAHGNLGNVLNAQGRLAEAASHHEQALRLKPDDAEAHNNLGDLLRERGELGEALACSLRAQTLDPDYPEAHWTEALLRLARGDFQAGWEKYEWRWRRKEAHPQRFGRPRWDGGDLAGRTIYLWAEQGRGDTIQFIRYAPMVKQLGARVIFECQPGLARLLEGAPGIDQVVTAGEALPPFDCQLPLLSLPRLFGTIAETIPSAVPYLNPNPALVEGWRGRGILNSGLNIGVVWRGSPTHKNDRKRSIAAEHVAELCGDSAIGWISLQKEATQREIDLISRDAPVRNCGPQLTDWAETAALISLLDLVVTVDTGVAHLAGALGKPVWVLLPFAPDWRWMMERTDSPWYPTMRLFRQPEPGNWNSVVSQVRSSIGRFGWII